MFVPKVDVFFINFSIPFSHPRFQGIATVGGSFRILQALPSLFTKIRSMRKDGRSTPRPRAVAFAKRHCLLRNDGICPWKFADDVPIDFPFMYDIDLVSTTW